MFRMARIPPLDETVHLGSHESQQQKTSPQLQGGVTVEQSVLEILDEYSSAASDVSLPEVVKALIFIYVSIIKLAVTINQNIS